MAQRTEVRRTAKVQVPVTPHERRTIEAQAERRHLTLAAYARQTLLDAVAECCDLFDRDAEAAP